jgi:hypothetical protein
MPARRGAEMLGNVPYLRLACDSLGRRREDDATMPTEWTMGVEDRLDKLEAAVVRLEVTVSRGFGELTKRMDGFDARMDRYDQRLERMNDKIDVTSESLRGDIQRVVDVVSAMTEHLDRTAENIRKEHEADRRLIYATLKDHRSRLASLEEIVGGRG